MPKCSKIEIIDNIDLYAVRTGEYSLDLCKLPDIMMDPVNYLLLTNSFYTIKAYKQDESGSVREFW